MTRNLLLLVAAFAACLVAISGSSKVRYDNFRVYRIRVENVEQMKFLNNLKHFPESYQFWKQAKNSGGNADIMVHPDKFEEFENTLKKYSLKSEVMIEDVQKLIDEEQNIDPALTDNPFGWSRYYKLSDIYSWLDDLQNKYPNQVTPFAIGKSYEGRTIRGIKISFKSGNPGIFIEANIHAREWIASATATYVIDQLLNSKDPKVRDIAENTDWYIIPVLNVDGFSYTHEVDRLWRKTRQPNPTSNCVGVDPNRNFDSYWSANGGASSNPCDETYAGPKPFSEPETTALANYFKSIKEKISIYIAFHTYGQLLLSPYGHTATEFPKNYEDMQTIASATTNSIAKRYGTSYRYGSTASILYTASGTSPDWAYNTQNAPLGFTFEFRDKGAHGFVLPPDQIKPNAEEAMDGLLSMVEQARKLNYLKQK